jgi:hypothetical protein
MPTIENLSITHSDYDAGEAGDLWALYEGGKEFEKRLWKFWPAGEREKPSTYEYRKRYWEYRNYTGSIIKHFATLLFTSKPTAQAFDSNNEQVIELDPYWTDLREDCTRTGTDVDVFFKTRIIEAMVKGKSWIAICKPNDRLGPATSKLDHEQRGLGDCWLKALDFDNVLDWDTDEDGNLLYVLHHEVKVSRLALNQARDWVTETWTHYTAESVDTYQIQYKMSAKPDRNTEVPLIDSFEHGFGLCPIVCLQLEAAEQIAAVLKSPQLSNFRLVSGQNWSLACTCYAQPIAKVADKEAFGEMMMGVGHGIVIGVDEDFGWDAPPAAHFAAMDVQIQGSKDEIHRLAFQMALGVDNNAAAIGRTAESKSQDAQSTRVALTAYGRIVKQTIERVYDLISSARGDDLEWDVIGLDDFAGIDTAGLIEMAMSLQGAGGIPSPTWNSYFKKKLAESMMPDLDESIKATINEEITDAVMNAPTQQEQELELFAAQHAIVAGDNSGGGLLAPQNKANATKNKGGAKKFSGPKPKKPSAPGKSGPSEFVKAKKPGGK